MAGARDTRPRYDDPSWKCFTNALSVAIKNRSLFVFGLNDPAIAQVLSFSSFLFSALIFDSPGIIHENSFRDRLIESDFHHFYWETGGKRCFLLERNFYRLSQSFVSVKESIFCWFSLVKKILFIFIYVLFSNR